MRTCVVCKTEIKNSSKYCCSRTCESSRRKKTRKNCLNCGLECEHHSLTYCSSSCSTAHRQQEAVKDWIAGKINPGRDFVKSYLVRTYGDKCSLCGWCAIHPVTGNVPVEVDHMDGNWTNNSPENVRLLCPNCHSLTPTFRALNKRPAPRNVAGMRKTITG